ncbi:MAG: DUF559 domain-containing protein [Bosea sp.]|uniref:endonuclease domain-containing protein n=1 Tax=Bosea sp. (in: a-proteobacteria) TaxID=1871050 RepID=UPI001AC17283|nr:DUF559 domain-containing protein [Bosea sp. (in: a-proteobacteria)]MBN9472284.1 DUF559 domain-containing protein [Bosea sp. (in: a-proteobacteria)]
MSYDPYDEIERRVLHSVAANFASVKARGVGDSPIERIFWAALWGAAHYGGQWPILGARLSHTDEQMAAAMADTESNSYHLLVQPQAEIGGWRVDFLVAAIQELKGRPFVWRRAIVECDGHEFHERTKEQAAKDRSRDREAQLAGLHVFRFTGSEIWRDPWACASQVCDWATKAQWAKI